MSALAHDPIVAADSAEAAAAIPVRFVGPDGAIAEAARPWAERMGFKGKPGQVVMVPGADGGIDHALVGVGQTFDPMSARALSARLPTGLYRLEAEPEDARVAALAFLFGRYAFDRYKARKDVAEVRLVAPDGFDAGEAARIASACALAREMVDTPAADMGPLQMETIAREIAEAHGATISVTTGDALLEQNYPAIHAVGRAAAPHRAPRILEIGWNLDRTDRPLIEFTEGEEMADANHVRTIVESYRKMGFSTAIDDFGAGHAGLGLLAKFQTDYIKLDMELIRDLDRIPGLARIRYTTSHHNDMTQGLIDAHRPAAGPTAVFRGGGVGLAGGATPAAPADVWLVRYEPAPIAVPVARGENAGVTLPHASVVRELVKLGQWSGGEARGWRLPAPSREGLLTAVIVQAPDGGPILRAAKA